MALDIACPLCGEDDDLSGERTAETITVTCGSCGQSWERSLSPVCPTCGGADLVTVPTALLERSRGTQLSVVGIRMVQLCAVCDDDDIDRWQKNLPRPLMPTDLPTVGEIDPDSVGG
jgi:hypothetical protein